ncbi:receptor kinase-like protein Xa21 [Oryza brachyantha]|nr:receptor kinase-like protein Xa21 [Oryza brachyantha]
MKNNINGQIPAALFNSSSLVFLDLSDNDLSGPIPSSPSMSLKLQYISLAANNLSGSIPDTLGNIASLSSLKLALNNLQGNIPESLSRIPSLQELDLSYNNMSGTVPSALYNITSLSYLGLGNNQFVGRIPADIGYTLPNIQTLVLEGNGFDGPIPVSLVNASLLQRIELRDNAFSGTVPAFWSLPNLTELDLGANMLEDVDWSSMSSATSSPQLQVIYLDNNNIQGTLPSSIGNISKSIQMIYLTNNRFTGTIPSEIGSLTNLSILNMRGNLFSGGIPNEIGNLRNLFVLSLARNKLSGEIPQSIGNLENLSELYLQENSLSGPIPSELANFKSLVMLNLSCNAFDGSIPPEILTISSLSESLDLSYNKLTGSIPPTIGALINLGSLNISNNQLSGEIPHALGECLHLESLRLEVNFLHGSIPESFMSLRGVTEMDISENNLSGAIPTFLETLTSLQLLNLSFNSFEGTVPTGGAFGNSSKVFLQGNKLLCTTKATMLQLPPCTSSTSNRKRNSLVISVVVPLALAAAILVACATITLFKKRTKCEDDDDIDQSCMGLKKFSYAQLIKATNGFSSANLVGSGRFGKVYKGTLSSETHPIAVKVFKLDEIGAPKNFFSECEVLKNTRHRNLVRVISLCSSFDQMGRVFKALVLEYMANGNLESWLYSKYKRPLSLGSRMTIATDIAAALDYLHNWCTPPLVHCDLKPSNVLLDGDMCAHVSDFGLAKFLCSDSSAMFNSLTSMAGPRGSLGYIAPEYGLGCEISTAGDVYSYGVILLEMLTGKHPTDDIFKDGLNIHKLVESAVPHNIGDILEVDLLACYKSEETRNDLENSSHAMAGILSCVTQLANLGLRCSTESPKDRPRIQDVYDEILHIKEIFSLLGS